jgi:dTDP-glucose 4,6-dehydratase
LNVREWLHVSDCVRAILAILEQGREGEIYNVGSGQECRNIDLVRSILEMLDKPKSLIQFVADRPGHDYRYALDIARITDHGWEPTVSLGEGLERTIRWYQEHPEWWRPLKSGEYWDYYKRNYRPLTTTS